MLQCDSIGKISDKRASCQRAGIKEILGLVNITEIHRSLVSRFYLRWEDLNIRKKFMVYFMHCCNLMTNLCEKGITTIDCDNLIGSWKFLTKKQSIYRDWLNVTRPSPFWQDLGMRLFQHLLSPLYAKKWTLLCTHLFDIFVCVLQVILSAERIKTLSNSWNFCVCIFLTFWHTIYAQWFLVIVNHKVIDNILAWDCSNWLHYNNYCSNNTIALNI